MTGSPLHIRKFGIADIRELQLRTSWGEIEVVGGDVNEITIEVYAYHRNLLNFFQPDPMTKDEFDKMDFRLLNENGKLTIRSRKLEENWFFNWISGYQVSFRVFVPEKMTTYTQNNLGEISLSYLKGNHLVKSTFGRIRLQQITGSVKSLSKSIGGSLQIEKCSGEFDLSTSGGNVTVIDSSGDHNYSTDGGNIRITDFSGKLQTKTKGGNVHADRVEGDFKTLSWGGNIKLYGLRANVAATTKGGNIIADADELLEYFWLESSGGNIRTYLPENSKITLDAKGRVVRINGNFQVNGVKTYNKCVGTINGGGTSVTLKTGGGNLRIFDKKISPQRPFKRAEIVEERPIPVEVISKEVPLISLENKASTHIPKKVKSKPKKEKSYRRFKPYLPHFSQISFAFFFTVLFVYGLNSITYFTSELFNPTSLEAVQNKAVFFLNLTTGIASFLGAILFISFLDNLISKKWAKYLALVGTTELAYIILQIFVFQFGDKYFSNQPFWEVYLGITQPAKYDVAPGFTIAFYGIIPSIVACAYYTYWRKSSNLTRKISEQEYQLLNLEKMKTKAQLNALEARINPHFLYNSLNSIAGLIHEDADKAEDMTIELSKLFRATTGRNEELTHKISEEINLVKSYLQIEQMRFGNRLKYEIEVDPNLKEIVIPRFLLQPLVENAIKHGISKIKENGIIRLQIFEKADEIHIEIHDNGPEFGQALSGGYGLKSVREKLRLIYGEHAALEISDNPEKLLSIRIDKDYEI